MYNGKLSNKKIILAFVLCLTLFVLVLSCSQQSSAPSTPTANPPKTTGPQYGGILRGAAQYDSIGFLGYPPKSSGAPSMKQSFPALETLLRTDKDGNVIPYLATGYKNDVAGKTITLTLQKGVKFHDGTDFNAAAVKWNLEQCIKDKALGSLKMKSVDVVDDYTVRLNLTEWDITAVSSLTQNMGMIISPTSYQKNGADWAASNPVGTGPFQFVSWVKDTKTIYKKFDNYWQKGKPYVDGIEYSIVLDSTTRLMSFQNKDIDLMFSVDAKDLTNLKNAGNDVIFRSVGSGAFSMAPDSINPSSPWSNIKVRQAAQYAIDVEALVKTVLSGWGEPANQWIYKAHWGYNPSVVGYPYNPTKAKQLLAEAGYPNGFKTTITYGVNPQNNLLFTAVQGMFNQVGITSDIQAIQVIQINQMAQGGKWQGLIHAGQSSNPDLAAALEQNFSGRWYTQMEIPSDLAAAIKNAINAPDTATEQKYCQEAIKLITDKYCTILMLYIWNPSGSAVAAPYVHDHGVVNTPNSGQWTPENVWMDKK